MKTRLIPVVMLCCLLAGCGKKTTTQLNDETLNGTVKTVTDTEYEASLENGELTLGDVVSTTFYTFDQAGHMTERVFVSADMPDTMRNEYSYNEAGLLTEEKVYAGSQLIHSHSLTYDAQGNVIERHEQFAAPAMPDIREEMAYDSCGNMIEERHFEGEDHHPAGRFEYRYDSLGRKQSDHFFNPEGHLAYGSDFKYGENGHMTEEHFIGPEHHLTTRNEYVCAPDGRRKEEHHFDSFGHPHGDMYYTYDRHNRLTEEQMLAPDSTILWKRVLKYGSKDNWNENIFYHNGDTPTSVIRREIQFF